MQTPRINYIFLAIFGLSSLTVLILSLLLPNFRAVAYAPLREWIIPPPDPIVISVLYSTEKELWLSDAITEFEVEKPKIKGHPVQIELEKMGSWEINTAILDGVKQPVIVSPASSLQIAALQDASSLQFGQSVVNPSDTMYCRPTVRTPLVLIAWKERADVLWGQNINPSFWDIIHDALIDPQGWAALGHPDWGYIKFGHTDPLKSNSGFMTILQMTYGYHNKTENLTASDILSDPQFQTWFLETEDSIGQFEYSTGPLMEKMVVYGPSTYDFVAVYEATALEQMQNAVGRYGELRVYYPPATLWSDHPFCVLNASWVTPDQKEAARLFIDHLTSRPAQENALMKYGFRPIDPSIQLEQPGSPFDRYASNGFRVDLTSLPEVEIPSGNILNILREFWSRNVTR